MSQSIQHTTVLDPGAEQVGKTYARALISAAASAGVADQVLDQLQVLVDEYLAGSDKLAAALASPRIDEAEKSRVIDRIFANEFHPVLVNFLKVMGKRGRLGYIAAVRNAANLLRDEMLGRLVAEVRTAVPMDDATRSLVTSRLEAAMKKQVRLQETVDPDLIGGMIVRIGDTVFDSSVANQIDKMARRARAGFSRELLRRFDSFTASGT
ncbi:MAG: ATP synthase F1 subunit delta [Planctomycetaceae bacterium]